MTRAKVGNGINAIKPTIKTDVTKIFTAYLGTILL